MMSNLLDINPILTKNKDDAWIKHVIYMSDNAKTIKDRIYWTEIKLGIYFQAYEVKHGEPHPKDPVNLDENPYLL